jgi:hypothetical protein
MLKKKILANFQRIIEFVPKNLSLSSQKYGFGIRDPRTGIRKKPIPDPGPRGQKGTGSRIRICNTGFLTFYFLSCREVRVKGTREEVTQCIFHICGLLLENPPKGTGTVVYLESGIISYSVKMLLQPGTFGCD